MGKDSIHFRVQQDVDAFMKKIIAINQAHSTAIEFDADLARLLAQIPASPTRDFLVHIGLFSTENIVSVSQNTETIGDYQFTSIVLKIPGKPSDIRVPYSPIAYFSTIFGTIDDRLEIVLVHRPSGPILGILAKEDAEYSEHVISLVAYSFELSDLIEAARRDQIAEFLDPYVAEQSRWVEVVRQLIPEMELVNKAEFAVVEYLDQWNIPISINGYTLEMLAQTRFPQNHTFNILMIGPTMYQSGYYHPNSVRFHDNGLNLTPFISPFLSTSPPIDHFFLKALLEVSAQLPAAKRVESCAGAGTVSLILAQRSDQHTQPIDLTVIEYNPWAAPFLTRNLASIGSGCRISFANASGFDQSVSDTNTNLYANAPAFMETKWMARREYRSLEYANVWDCGEPGMAFFCKLVCELDRLEFNVLLVWNNYFTRSGDPATWVLLLHPLVSIEKQTRIDQSAIPQSSISTLRIRKRPRDETLSQLPEQTASGQPIWSNIIQRLILNDYEIATQKSRVILTSIFDHLTELTDTDCSRLILAALLGKLDHYPEISNLIDVHRVPIARSSIAHYLFGWGILDRKFIGSTPIEYSTPLPAPVAVSKQALIRGLTVLAQNRKGIANAIFTHYISQNRIGIFLFPIPDLNCAIGMPNIQTVTVLNESHRNPFFPYLAIQARTAADYATVWTQDGTAHSIAESRELLRSSKALPTLVQTLIQYATEPISLHSFIEFLTLEPFALHEIAYPFLNQYRPSNSPDDPIVSPPLNMLKWVLPGTTIEEIVLPNHVRKGDFRFVPIFIQLDPASRQQIPVVVYHDASYQLEVVDFGLDELILRLADVPALVDSVITRLQRAASRLSQTAPPLFESPENARTFVYSLFRLESRSATERHPLESNEFDCLFYSVLPLGEAPGYQKGLVTVYAKPPHPLTYHIRNPEQDYEFYTSCESKVDHGKIQHIVLPNILMEMLCSVIQANVPPTELMRYLIDPIWVQVIVSHGDLFLAQPLSLGELRKLSIQLTVALWCYRENSRGLPFNLQTQKLPLELRDSIHALLRASNRLLDPSTKPIGAAETLFIAAIRLSACSYQDIETMRQMAYELIPQLTAGPEVIPPLLGLSQYSINLDFCVRSLHQALGEPGPDPESWLIAAMQILSGIEMPIQGRPTTHINGMPAEILDAFKS